MTPRTQALLGTISPSAVIIEIGPSFNPVVPKSGGWNVRSIDHATRAELIDKYAADPAVDTSRIEEVDYIWRGGSLADAVPPADHGSFDAFVASHVIEHTPDLVAFLDAASVLLKPSGVVCLAIPDKRYCFDYFQPLTTTGAVIEAHTARYSQHRIGTIYDHCAYLAANGDTFDLGQHPICDLRLFHDLSSAKQALDQATQAGGEYIDAHNWRFTPSSFRLVMLELAWLGLTNWKIERMTEPQGCEFITQLRGGGTAWARAFWPDEFQAMRLDLLKTTLIEQRTQIDFLVAGEPGLGAWSGA